MSTVHPAMIHQRIEAQVARTPEAVAVVFEDRRLTYGELNRRANKLAHHLRRIGVEQESIVGVYIERSLDMVVALLAVLKAGGAYLPLEPTHPSERVAFMLEDAGASVLLTHERLKEGLPRVNATTIFLDSRQSPIDEQAAENLPSTVTPANLAYVMYTSGSTGKPKAAMNHHRGMLNRLLWMQDLYDLCQSDCVVQKTPFGFDVSVWEFFWPLIVGARLLVARPGGHSDPKYMSELIARERVTIAHFVPSMLQVFVKHPDVAKCESLRMIFCSGEALPVDLQNRCLKRMNVKLYNLYGPTECAVDVSHWTCRPDENRLTVPIGRPAANVQLYVLDHRLYPVPVGMLGELYIGGVQVGRGYLNRPDLTAERFIPDPFGIEPGARLYKTGDRARWRADGNLEFHGRLDFQVKIRGFRIELGEVEAVLAGHAGVRESVVVARSDVAGGDQRLVAYIVPQGPAPSLDDLRSYLRAKLPDYMVPSAFVVLERLPVTSNGKLDRRALPAPDFNQTSAVAYVAPRTEAEKLLADIWAQVLEVDRVGLHDNFFDLGGHSLLATQAISRIRKAFGVEPALASLFQAPTVAEFSVNLASFKQKGDRLKPAEPEIKPIALMALRARVNEISEDEVDVLLRDILRQ